MPEKNFRVGDKVRIKSKSIGESLEKLQQEYPLLPLFYNLVGYIAAINGDPYSEEFYEDRNYFLVASTLTDKCSFGFSWYDIELCGPDEEKNVSVKNAVVAESNSASAKKRKFMTIKEGVITVSGSQEMREYATEGELFGFAVSDIITCECGECSWDGKYILVRGFDFDNKRLYGLVFDGIEIDYDEIPQESSHKQKLRIVQRNQFSLGYLADKSARIPANLQIGDEIIVVSGAGQGHEGKIIAINDNYLNPYVVELFGYQFGEKSPNYLIKHFNEIPNPKILPSTCLFKEARELAFVSEFGKKLPINPSEQVKLLDEISVEDNAIAIISLYLDMISQNQENYPLMKRGAKQAIVSSKDELLKILDEKTTDSLRSALKNLAIFLYEELTDHSEKTDISFSLDGYPMVNTYNPDISEKFSLIIAKMIKGDFLDIDSLKIAIQTDHSKKENRETRKKSNLINEQTGHYAVKKFFELEELFDKQIQTLRDRGYPTDIIAVLESQKKEVVAMAQKMTFEAGRIPFIPVIPHFCLSIQKQMATVLNGKKIGDSSLNINAITHLDGKTSYEPYYIFNVGDGKEFLGKTGEESEKIIIESGRRGLTEVEIIALSIHAGLFHIWAVNSRYVDPRVAPIILLDPNDTPYLYHGILSNYWSNRGTPSCGHDTV